MKDNTVIYNFGDWSLVFVCMDDTSNRDIHFAVTYRGKVWSLFGSGTGYAAFRYAYSDFRRMMGKPIPADQMRYFS